ncbi:hypothetical protein Tcan_14723 [Toxocara canis]|uniref:Uncharacterized protein n=1 Tax=Toxocara canis TaxID=6265 RepID=A0A0B2UTS2_TOXCA|nr:hypothetical protein Tcan_14723 [Toxocara canis]
MGLIIILLAICIVSTSAGLLPEEILLRNSIPNCKDGKGPLLAADHVYSCKEGCPEGFVCEYQDKIKRLEKGICCPDLDILYRLYGNDDEAQEQQNTHVNVNHFARDAVRSVRSTHYVGMPTMEYAELIHMDIAT